MFRLKCRHLIVLICHLALMTFFCLARDCEQSKPFTVKKGQTLSGVLLDPTGAVIPNAKLVLQAANKDIRDVKTANNGEYSFGEVSAGEYQLKIVMVNHVFCAPKVKCNDQKCTIQSKVKFSPKVKFITVE